MNGPGPCDLCGQSKHLKWYENIQNRPSRVWLCDHCDTPTPEVVAQLQREMNYQITPD